jgi:hypothetical protein
MPIDDPGLWKWMTGGLATAASGLAAYVWNDSRKKLDEKADKEDMGRVEKEQERHRDHLAKLYEKLEEHGRSDAAHFSEVMGTMHDHHAELLREMGRKADRS